MPRLTQMTQESFPMRGKISQEDREEWRAQERERRRQSSPTRLKEMITTVRKASPAVSGVSQGHHSPAAAAVFSSSAVVVQVSRQSIAVRVSAASQTQISPLATSFLQDRAITTLDASVTALLSESSVGKESFDPGQRQKQLQVRIDKTRRELQQLSDLMEASERRILPLPKRRVASGSSVSLAGVESPQQTITPNVLFNKLHSLNDEVVAISEALSEQQSSSLFYEGVNEEVVDNNNLQWDLNEDGLVEQIENSDDEEEDDSCTGCRDWLENVKNKKKRKIPTSAVMGHTNTVSSPVHQAHHGLGVSPGRTAKLKTRRRRTWDVSSEIHPDANFRNGKPIMPTDPSNAPQSVDGLFQRDFEFTCDSPVARNLPAPPPASVEILPTHPISIATQTSPSLAAMDAILPPRHRRTKEEKAYDRQRLVAKKRRDERAKLKPGEKETFWVCNFCEFESVLGYPPLALMYAYTKRMREEKRELVKRKRLLDKARSKGKKKKKGALPTNTDNSHSAIPAVNNSKIAPTLQNGGKTGIDKAIGPSSSNCTCCDHRRDKEERERRHRERHAQNVAEHPHGDHFDHHHGSVASDNDDITRSSSRMSRHNDAADLVF